MALNRDEILKDPVRDISVNRDMKISDLIESFSDMGGFTASKLYTGTKILERMFTEENTTFLSFPADIISTGLRGVINQLVSNKMVDAIITTTGTLDHDIARSVSSYYCGLFEYSDRELADIGVSRLGNVVIPEENYGPIIEAAAYPVLEKLYSDGKDWSGVEILREMGMSLSDPSSILYNAAINNIPVFVPGITDGSFGSQLWSFYESNRDFRVNLLEDEHRLSDIIFESKKTGALMIGGGISKHHTIWWNQFREGLDYAVYLTTAQEFDGSLSGARLEEAISWKKVKADAEFVNITGEATVILPLLVASFL